MITVSNVQHYDGLSWDDYLQLPGKSFSGLKEGAITETEGMKIGKAVHTYLLKPKEYTYERHDIVRPIAVELVKYVGINFLKEMVCECPMSANFESEGIVFKWKGIPDMKIPKVIVVDFKILAGDLDYYIERFNYKEQLRGYMMPNEADLGLIIGINRINKQIKVQPVDQNKAWWKNIVLSRGEIKSKHELTS